MFSPTDEMLSIGRVALRIIGVHFPLAGFSIIAGSACQALGKPIYALINSVCRQIVVLLPAAYLSRSRDGSSLCGSPPRSRRS